MARSWARELAPRNIRVNVINPGPIESNLRSFLSDQARQEFEKSVIAQVPLGRIGRADEAAAVALFLLSDDASYVTGSQIAVDGGLISL
jgi:NAD(P)-dependent dehydrogenase (short-subunit alcohol dehydrogenase family)